MAFALQVDSKYPAKQIDAIKTIIAAENKKKIDDSKALEDKYKSLIKKADEYMAKNDFANASAIYKQALNLKPEDNYAIAKKEKADMILIKATIKQKDKNYNDTIALADNALKLKDYERALTMYWAAIEIKPLDNYPVNKIKEINDLLALNNDEASKQTKDKRIEKLKRKSITEKAFSQKIQNDHIKKLFSSVEAQEKKGNIKEVSKLYIEIANFFHENGQLARALGYLNNALSILKKENEKEGEVNILDEMANVYYDSGQYRQSISTYKEALSIKKETGDIKGQADILSEMGAVLENTYQYELAADAFEKALVIRQQLGDNEGVSEDLNKLGGIYYSQNDYSKSLEFFNKALTIADSSNNKDMKGSLFNSIGVVYYKMGNFEEALKYYNQSISVDQESGNKKNMSQSYNNIGNINYDWSKYEKAIEYYQKSLTLKKEINFEQGMAVSMLNIGNSYLELKNYLKANEFLTSGLELAKKIKFHEVVQLSYKSL
jgi:tetratricopeptide (TPR) repeat protein